MAGIDAALFRDLLFFLGVVFLFLGTILWPPSGSWVLQIAGLLIIVTAGSAGPNADLVLIGGGVLIGLGGIWREVGRQSERKRSDQNSPKQRPLPGPPPKVVGPDPKIVQSARDLELLSKGDSPESRSSSGA